MKARNEEKQDQLIEKAKKTFGPQFWCKPGYEWEDGAIFWTGEGAMIDEMPAYDHWSESPFYTNNCGIHPKLAEFAERNGMFLEPNDAGTLIGYEA